MKINYTIEYLKQEGEYVIEPCDMTDEEYAVAVAKMNMAGHKERAIKMKSADTVTDEDILAWMAYEFGLGGGCSDDRLGWIGHKGGSNPHVDYGAIVQRDKTKIHGKKLMKIVRKLYGLEKQTQIGMFRGGF